MLRRVIQVFFLAAISVVAGCKSTGRTDINQLASEQLSSDTRLCAAVRGNGLRIFAHFGGLANLVENVGLPDGIAGSSSASITAFIYESIRLNPHLYQCGDALCSEAQVRERAAFLLKSIESFINIAKDQSQRITESVNFFSNAVRMTDQNVQGQTAELDLTATRDLLNKELIGRLGTEVIRLTNPELLDFLLSPEAPKSYKLEQIQSAVSMFGSFDATDPQIFLRPGLLSFEALAKQVGVIASFYAAYPPVGVSDWDQQWQSFLGECGQNHKNRIWQKLENRDPAIQTISNSCQERFASMIASYFQAGPQRNRINDTLGQASPGQKPIFVLISTSLTQDSAVQDRFRSLQVGFNRNELDKEGLLIVEDFNKVQFGFWSSSSSALSSLQQNRSRNKLLEKFFSLGNQPWSEIIALSPAEPGLTNAQFFRDGQYLSFGGWSSLFPTVELQVSGECDRVAFITRKVSEADFRDGNAPMGEKGFARGVASQLGMTAAQDNALYTLSPSVAEESAFRQAIQAADFSVCTDWDSVDLSEDRGFNNLILDGYTAPILTRSEVLQSGCAQLE